MPVRRSAALLALLTLVASVPAAAQDGDVRIRATRRDTIRAGATITAAFNVANTGSQSVKLATRVDAPAEWSLLMAPDSLVVPGLASELAMVGVAVPSRAAAGNYVIRVALLDTTQRLLSADSVVVAVPPRRALFVAPLNRPGFVVSGKDYDVTFLVRNRGNLPTDVVLATRSSHSLASLAESRLRLNAEDGREVRVRVRTQAGFDAATDDVVELMVASADLPDSVTQTSARVIIVPEPSRSIEEFLRVPTQVRVRAASSDGVSPFEITGSGRVRDDGAVNADFLVRGPTGRFSPFGDRDEYRLALWAKDWRARVGDHFFMLTPLTGAAQPGFGVGGEAMRGVFSAGAYGQQFRRAVEKGNEIGGFVGATPTDDSRVTFNLVNRAATAVGTPAGTIASVTGGLRRYGIDAEAELARSGSRSAQGLGRSLRLSGSSPSYAFDLGHLSADTGFTGVQRGGEHTFLTTSSHRLESVSFALSGSRHRTDLSPSIGMRHVEEFTTGSASATLAERYTLELFAAARATENTGSTQAGRQHSARARVDQELAFGFVTIESELGTATDAGGTRRQYNEQSASLRHSFRNGTAGIWGERYSGGSITKGLYGTLTMGADLALLAIRRFELGFQGYATRSQAAGDGWHTQADVLVTRHLRTGRSVSLRARALGGGTLPSAERTVAYLEYAMPMRLPVSRLRTPGRVYGRVVDASNGRGVPGALVRLGPQIAITDKNGQVAFGGVPGGEHRVSMSQETSFTDAVFVGDPTLLVDSARTRPTTFELAIARGARIDVAVRRFVVARTGIGGAPDSLADGGPLANAMLMLTAGRDTIYRTTTEAGKASFSDVPPGTWVMTIRGDAPAFHRFDPDRIELTLGAGETKTLEFRLLPRRREVQVIGPGEELKPQPSDPKAAQSTRSTRTVKPNN